ncbi:unnamed protein product [Protopolystoma xenopodis]|uniref:Secreted protein n=1 Tax=Protopolystoma xenopodis TaxID=117903 RepID=A0A3S5BU84_9PLAT|nr:unnamed protein product [Protopolystoma xenopodis]
MVVLSALLFSSISSETRLFNCPRDDSTLLRTFPIIYAFASGTGDPVLWHHGFWWCIKPRLDMFCRYPTFSRSSPSPGNGHCRQSGCRCRCTPIRAVDLMQRYEISPRQRRLLRRCYVKTSKNANFGRPTNIMQNRSSVNRTHRDFYPHALFTCELNIFAEIIS